MRTRDICPPISAKLRGKVAIVDRDYLFQATMAGWRFAAGIDSVCRWMAISALLLNCD
jgi:hypothetical protein